MVSNFTKKYIKNRAREESVAINNDCNAEILEEYCNIAKNMRHKLEFRKGRGLSYKKLNSNAGFFKNSSIVFTPEWAYHLITSKGNIDNAFLITLGHEISHKVRDVNKIRIKRKDRQFCAWVTEMFCDFNACRIMTDSDRQRLVSALEYKHSFQKLVPNESCTHPSIKRRLYYAQNYDFDNILIEQIAYDIGCSNRKLIEFVKAKYKKEYVYLK